MRHLPHLLVRADKSRLSAFPRAKSEVLERLRTHAAALMPPCPVFDAARRFIMTGTPARNARRAPLRSLARQAS
jgi:hypothetical protein